MEWEDWILAATGSLFTKQASEALGIFTNEILWVQHSLGLGCSCCFPPSAGLIAVRCARVSIP